MRVFSFSQESTRYCNYSKDKFGNELTFILPEWVANHHNFKGVDINSAAYAVSQVGNGDSPNYQFISLLGNAESHYLKLIELGWTPQQARSVLPNALKTELIMTGFMKDWEHFFKLRCAKSAHPQARELAIPLQIALNTNNN